MKDTTSSGPSLPSSDQEINFPTITLDRTLADLYRETCPSLSNKRIGHIFCGTTCAVDLSPDFPRNRKYIYQDGSFNDADRSSKSDGDVRRTLAPKYLSLIPQRDAFIAGPEAVIFFYSGSGRGEIEHDEKEAERTLGVLGEGQRCEILFCKGPGDVGRVMEENGIDKLEVKLVVDGIAEPEGGGETKMLVDPDVLWFLNGKEALAKSGLPTPVTDVIEVRDYGVDREACCEVCVSTVGDDVSETCSGPRSEWIAKQTKQILDTVKRWPLPFVFKNQQAFAGAGTYVVTSEADREQLLEDMTNGGILRRLLGRITKDNAHLRPGSILLMKLIEDPVADYGLTFFVGENGSHVFLAVSEQMIDRESSSWIGSKISYPHQDDLKQKFGALIDQTAAWLSEQGYFGPAGADILETKDGDYQIVDLNVRTSGSLCLPLMQSHFTSRGLQCASSLSVTVQKSRQEFCEQWRDELESGKLCIVAWYEDDDAGKSFGDVVVGAEDDDALSEVLAKIRELTEQVTF